MTFTTVGDFGRGAGTSSHDLPDYSKIARIPHH